MTIATNDIKLMQAQRMTETPDGGGRISGNEVDPNASNTLFNDISDLDRTYGKVDISKAFLQVASPNDDIYLGANVALAEAPADATVSVTLMSTGDHYDERADAQNRIESYLTKSIQFDGMLLGNQVTGQRMIVLQQRPEGSLPAVNETLVLIQDEGTGAEQEQYVRVTKTDAELREFTIMRNGSPHTFERKVITCEISEPLRYDFEGEAPTDLDGEETRSVVRETFVANASKFFGVSPLARAGALNDLSIRVADIYSQVVPSSRAEIPAVDLNLVGEVTTLTPANNSTITNALLMNIKPGQASYIGTAVMPGTLVTTTSSGDITDHNGTLKLSGAAVGTIDYQRGILSFGVNCPDLGAVTVSTTWQPAATPTNYMYTESIPVTVENRGYAYVYTFEKNPAPGTLTVSYMVAGKWYTLTDGGAGQLSGADASAGAGTLNYDTGSLMLTLGALPDAETLIVLGWGVETTEVDRTELFNNAAPWFEHQLADDEAFDADTVQIEWDDPQNPGTTLAITLADQAKGALALDKANGIVKWRPDHLPGPGAEYQLSFSQSAVKASAGVTLINGNELPIGGQVLPGSVVFKLQLRNEQYQADSSQFLIDGDLRYRYPEQHATVIVFDDGLGNLKTSKGDAGTIDYATGDITLDASISAEVVREVRRYYQFGGISRQYTNQFEQKLLRLIDQTVSINYQTPDAATSKSVSVTPAALQLDFEIASSERMTSSSVSFLLNGQRYTEADGQLRLDDVLAGSAEHYTGQLSITTWAAAAFSFELQSAHIVIANEPWDKNAVFRVIGAPVAPQSFYINIPGLGSATADENGDFSTDEFTGHIDYKNGVVEAQTVGDLFFDMSQARYNCVVYNYIPLDSSIIGLDPVRLPSDGRVPIYQKGDVVIIHQKEQRPEAAMAPNTTLDCGKTRCAEIYLQDLDGNQIAATDYTINPDAGTLTTGSGWSVQDVELVWRWEDSSLVTDVDISGELKLSKPLSHHYDIDKANVSSMCISGSLWARYEGLFDQQTWTGDWSDELTGEMASATFNDADYPLTLTNQGAITERWAIVFTSNTSFKVIGEHIGQIALGSINSDLAPLNPNSGQPYFTLPLGGWGSGWSAGNVLRFNTHGAIFPFWTIRTVLQSASTIIDDQFSLMLRGNINRDV